MYFKRVKITKRIMQICVCDRSNSVRIQHYHLNKRIKIKELCENKYKEKLMLVDNDVFRLSLIFIKKIDFSLLLFFGAATRTKLNNVVEKRGIEEKSKGFSFSVILCFCCFGVWK